MAVAPASPATLPSSPPASDDRLRRRDSTMICAHRGAVPIAVSHPSLRCWSLRTEDRLCPRLPRESMPLTTMAFLWCR